MNRGDNNNYNLADLIWNGGKYYITLIKSRRGKTRKYYASREFLYIFSLV